MKKMLSYLREYKKECVLAPAFKMLEASFELIVPLIIASLIDSGIGESNYTHVYRMVFILAILAFVGFIVAVTAQFFAAKAAIGFATKLRHSLFEHLMGLSYTDVDGIGTSTMITRMTSDVNQAQNGVNMFLRLFLRSPFVVFGAMIMAFTIDTQVALIFVVTIAVLFVVVIAIMRRSIPANKKAQGRLDKVTQATRETLNGVRVIRAFRLEREEMGTFKDTNLELSNRQRSAANISGMMGPSTFILINLGIVGVIVLGGYRVEMGGLTQGQVVALYNYMSQILVELVKLANLVVTLNKALGSANRISEVLNIKTSMKEGTGVINNSDDAPAMEFDNVSLIYQGTPEPSIRDISFKAYRGQTIGIIGGTGSGKSSMVNLLARFFDATQGTVLLDGIDIKEYTYDQLHSKIGVVMQKAVLFAGTIADNLRMANPDITEEDMLDALRKAQALKVVEDKGGLEAIVEPGGRNFSGGQRQRLSIARTLASHPSIVILDDSSSALDYATDLALRRALKELGEETTVFIISQRTSSLKHADQIIVLEDGEMVGIGTHDELLESCDVYQEIHNSQLHKEEVTA